MKRFIDKNGEIFTMLNESTFDKYLIETLYYFKDVDSACSEDYMRELCKRIFGRIPYERPPEVQKRITTSMAKLIRKLNERR